MPTENELARAAGGVILGGFDGVTLPESIHARLAAGALGGVILFKRNVENARQVWALCRSIRDAVVSGPSPVIAVDQEGGRVARLGAPLLSLPPMRVLGAIDDVALTFDAARSLGRGLARLGFTLDFAPVADVDSNPANPIIGDRSFARDAATVARHVVAFVEGLQSVGIAACAKHFPGHGDTTEDSHLALPRVRHARGRIDDVELPPFRAAVRANVATIMTAHVVFDSLAPDTPATIAPAILGELLRAQLGFEGVCVSDDLFMQGIAKSLTVEQSAVRSIAAGCDALLICTDPDAQVRAADAMRREAESNSSFADRLRDAESKMTRLRHRWPARPVEDASATGAVDREDGRVSREIATRRARLGV